MKTIAVALIALGLASQPAFGVEGSKDRHERWERMTKELDLTEAQKKQVQGIKERYQDDFEAVKTRMKAAREELTSGLKSSQKGASYQGALLGKFKALQALRNEFAEKRFQMALEIREILNKDQIAKFQALHEFDKHRKGPGRRGD